MPVGTLVDAEAAVRAWARATAAITSVATGGVYFGIPERGATWPLLTLKRVGGAPHGGEAPIDRALIQFDAWGSTKENAAAAAVAVANAARSLHDGDAMGASAVGQWARVETGPVWAPDPDSGRARYVVDVAFGLRST